MLREEEVLNRPVRRAVERAVPLLAPREAEPCTGDFMAWATLQFSKGQIDKAGEWLAADDTDIFIAQEMFTIINNWRASHSYPLLAMRMTLTTRAKKVDERSIVAQRLKRIFSIGIKLRRNSNMALSQMQDIGGCRAIVKSVTHVERLVKAYDDAWAKIVKAKRQAEASAFVKKYDYIASPKKDGYRGVHLIYKYQSTAKHKAEWNGLRIELQIRSRLQHAWATAVETVDTFTAQAIKTGGGQEAWRRFFLLMGSAIAGLERRPLCPDTPSDPAQLKDELRKATEELNVLSVLRGWRDALQFLPTQTSEDAAVWLLYLDSEKDTVRITGFPSAKQAKASEVYLSTERSIKDKPGSQAVLVSASSVQALRSAFPNYFADTSAFIDALKRAIE